MMFIDYFLKLRKFYVKEIHAHLWLNDKMREEEFDQHLIDYIGSDERKASM